MHFYSSKKTLWSGFELFLSSYKKLRFLFLFALMCSNYLLFYGKLKAITEAKETVTKIKTVVNDFISVDGITDTLVVALQCCTG